MAEFKELINCLSTEDMIDNGTAPIVYYNGRPGYLYGYNSGLGFQWVSKDQVYPVGGYEVIDELLENELSLLPKSKEDDIKCYIGHRTPVIVEDKLYYFGHYTKNGCVLYKKGEFTNKQPHFFTLDQIHVPTRKELDRFADKKKNDLFLRGIRKYGWNSEFRKEYVSLMMQLRFDELNKLYKNYNIE